MSTATSTLSSPTSSVPNRPRVGVAVFIIRPRPSKPSTDTTTPPSFSSSSITEEAATTLSRSTTPSSSSQFEFIIGRRLGSHGAGTYALPGGHLEYGETFETCAAREVHEETGLTVTNIRYLTSTNDFMPDEDKHYITIFMVAQIDHEGPGAKTEPELCEPHKCAGWQWTTWETLVALVEETAGEEGGAHSHGGSSLGKKKLFLPMVNLVRQRPGVVPSFF